MKYDHKPANIFLGLVSLFFVCIQSTQFAHAQEASRFIRFVPGVSDWNGELQTSIISFSDSLGTKLDLVSAVHLGDKEYYEQLNEEFRNKDIVLYELIAETGQGSNSNSMQTGFSPISFIQKAMGSFLELSFQLEQIDYSPRNFIHADLNPSQLKKAMAVKDQNLFSTLITLAAAQSANGERTGASQITNNPLDFMSLLNALTSGDHINSLKYLVGEELGKAGGLRLTEGVENQIPILGGRNRAVINRLAEAISDSANQSIAIFYGAAHMPGIERSITEELGFERESQRWLPAWQIP